MQRNHPAQTDACLTTFIKDFGLRAWRDVRSNASGAGDVSPSSESQLGLGDPIRLSRCRTWHAALLESPNFLYLRRAGRARSGASRVWRRYTGRRDGVAAVVLCCANSSPDAELLAAAADWRALSTPRRHPAASQAAPRAGASPSQELHDRALYGEYLAVCRLVSDESRDHASEGGRHQTGRWPASLQAEAAIGHRPHRPFRKTELFARRLSTRRAPSIDANLARLYGLTPPSGSGMQPTSFPDGSPRGGIVTTGAVLVS